MNYAISSLPLALRRMATLAMGAMMALAVVSCDDDTDEPDPVTPPATVSRTLLMYLPWSTDLTNYFYNNISDMKKAIAAQGLDGQRVLVFMCTTATEAQLFELVPDGSGCRQVKLRDYSSPSYTTAEGIASILADVKAEAPAEHYAMTIGCHGMGWVPVSQSRAMRLAPRQGYHWDAGGGPLTRFFGGRTPSVQTDITTLAEGIEGAGMHLDFILFDDCYMSSVEVAYDLRHVTDYLIVCPTEIMAYGMPYAEVGAELLGEPDYEAVCSKFLDFYSSYTYPYGTIGVTRTSELDSLARVLRKIEVACDLDASLLPSLQRMDGYRPPIFTTLATMWQSSAPTRRCCQSLRGSSTGRCPTRPIPRSITRHSAGPRTSGPTRALPPRRPPRAAMPPTGPPRRGMRPPTDIKTHVVANDAMT